MTHITSLSDICHESGLFKGLYRFLCKVCEIIGASKYSRWKCDIFIVVATRSKRNRVALTVLISRESDLDTKPMFRLKIGLVLTGCADWIKFIKKRANSFSRKNIYAGPASNIWFVFYIQGQFSPNRIHCNSTFYKLKVKANLQPKEIRLKFSR